jgi:sphinganine-1-phosphate aldolase
VQSLVRIWLHSLAAVELLSSRDWAYDKKGITEPEMVVPVSAHAAFEKAAHYFKIKMRPIPVDQESRRVDLNAVKRAINVNTIWQVCY